MAAATTNKFTDTFNSANPNSARVTSTRTSGASSLSCDNLAGWPTVSKVHFATYKIDTNNAKVAGSQIDWYGIVSGNTIGSMTRLAGAADSGNAIGDVVEMMPTGSWAHDLYSGLTQEHNQDGTHGAVTATSVTAGSLVSTGDVSDTSVTLKTIRSEVQFDYIASGCVLSGTGYGSTLAWSLTSGVVYIGGKRLTVAAATGTVTASKDTYFDLLDPGTGTVATLVNTSGNIVANNAASPALAANSVRLGIIVSGANIAAATSVNQGQETMVLPIASSVPYAVTDSLGNLICPRDPNRKLLGYRQVVSSLTTTSTTVVQATGLSVPVIVPTGRKVAITVVCGQATNSSSQNNINLAIWDGTVGSGTQLNLGLFQPALASVPELMNLTAMTTPSTASKTYNVGIFTTGTNTATYAAGAVQPFFIKVELI